MEVKFDPSSVGETAYRAVQDARDRMDVKAALDRSSRNINKTGSLIESSEEAVKRSHDAITRMTLSRFLNRN
jgi:hypothetical protein